MIKGSFKCHENSLINLKHFPKETYSDFSCNANNLTSLEYSPEVIRGDFDCYNNRLTSLKYCLKKVYDNFYCSKNELTSLEDLLKCVNNTKKFYYLSFYNNKITYKELVIIDVSNFSMIYCKL